MTLGINGLVSGLDTASIINSLIQVAAGPQTQLKSQAGTQTALMAAMQTVNAGFASLAAKAADLTKPGGLALVKAASSSPAITASASSGASVTSLDLSVTQLAQSHSVVSAAMAAAPGTSMTFVKADGTKTEVTAGSASLDDMALAINNSDAGISAVTVAAGKDTDGNTTYRLQLTSRQTGAAAAFTAYFGNAAEVDGGTAPKLTDAATSAVLSQGQDAQVTLWAGTAAATTITSASNTFTGIAPGLDITVNARTDTPATVSVASDTDKVSAAAGSLVAGISSLLGSIKSGTAVSTTVGANGSSTVTGGVFTGQSSVTMARDRLYGAVSDPVAGQSPSGIGINTTKDGDITFDPAAFAAAYVKDPGGVTTALQTITGRVAAAAASVSDPVNGTLTQRIQGGQKTIDSLNSQISDWDGRLAAKRSTLQAQYNSMEVQLGKLQSQQSWLNSQLDALSANGKSSK